ncbi:CHRNA1 [Mytilus edulis]|uniref:CHRNA1 n=1 Tax=Mytilus edulis TaxID=6550 RepID=A0A8S3SUP1_MYTED|nr:CHRNA1 [Mytilus edulis]
MNVIILCICLIVVWMFVVQGFILHTDVQKLNEYLTNVSKYVKPRINQLQPVNVDIMLSMNTIQDYDEISGNLIFTASFAFFWNDELKMWNPYLYNGIVSTQLPILQTWVPALFLQNGVNQNSLYTFSNIMDIETTVVTYNYNGNAGFIIFGQYQITCESDVTHFPFDEHVCTISLYTIDILNGISLSSERGIFLDASIANAEWTIKPNSENTFVTNHTFYLTTTSTTQDKIQFSFTIKREYLFPFLNIIFPVIILSFSHFLVFLLPVVSGERTSFSFTLLLSVVVFMTAASEQLPPSNNISIFNIFLLHLFVFSILITTLVVFSIQLFYKDTYPTENGVLFKVVLLLYVCFHKTMVADESINNQSEDDNKEAQLWKKVASFFDRFCLFFFFVCFLLQLIVYGSVLANI